MNRDFQVINLSHHRNSTEIHNVVGSHMNHSDAYTNAARINVRQYYVLIENFLGGNDDCGYINV